MTELKNTKHAGYNADISADQVVYAEITNVVSAMRGNARWSGMNVTGSNFGMLSLKRKIAVRGPDVKVADELHMTPVIVRRPSEDHPDQHGEDDILLGDAHRHQDAHGTGCMTPPPLENHNDDAIHDYRSASRICTVRPIQFNITSGGLTDIGTGLGGGWGNETRGDENPLLGNFGILRSKLARGIDPLTMDALELLYPFLEVIRSSDTTGPITSTALVILSSDWSSAASSAAPRPILLLPYRLSSNL